MTIGSEPNINVLGRAKKSRWASWATLAKLVLAREGVRSIPDADAKLAHELADCLWSVIVLAQVYEVDLEHAFTHTMDELEAHLGAQNRNG